MSSLNPSVPISDAPNRSDTPPWEPEAILNWCAFGLDKAWLHARLEPIVERHRSHLHRVPDPAGFDALLDPECDWDLAWLSADPAAQGTAAALETMLDRVARARPLEAVVALAPDDSPERRLLLMRLGAVDVVTPEDPEDRLEQAMERAMTVVRLRRRAVDQEKLRIVSQLAVSINHEVNNPLTGIMGTAELMLMDPRSLSERQRRDLEVIMQQCRRIVEVTNRLKRLNHLRTVPYGMHDRMLDLIGEPPPTVPHEAPPAAEQFLPAPRLLVVDDNPLIIDLIARMFEQRYRIEAAGCASDALARVERTEYDLVLIDLILPEMNGLELYRAIRRLRPRQKAILTTSHQGDARVEQAIAEGALGCVYKPFQLEEMEAALDRALKGRTADA